MSGLLFCGESRSQLYWVELRPRLVEKLERIYAENSTGGVLREVCSPIVGRHSDDSATAICSALLGVVTGEYSTVEIDEVESARNAKLLSDLWGATGGEIFYLGDWHMHPGQPAEASATDIETALRTSANEATQCPEFIMLITGSDGTRCYMATDGEFFELKTRGLSDAGRAR